MNLLRKIRSGKNRKFTYYFINTLRYITPMLFFQIRLKRELNKISLRDDREYIEKRVSYYNKISSVVSLPKDSKSLSEHRYKKGGVKSVYFFDTYMYIRWFNQSLKWCHCFGDITYIPELPSILKSRPIMGDNENSVILNLDKVRHFIFLKDKIPFSHKMNKIIYRGNVEDKPKRVNFMKMYFVHPMCDLGDVTRYPVYPEWKGDMKTLWEHLKYKFVLALEGNDVASNLKWVMSSNSVAVMPRPEYETWFMEGKLIPNYHYIEIKSDYSDLEERLNYYIVHEDEALQIIQHAHEYVAQFKNKKREKLISLLVLQKYFQMTGQVK